MLAAAMALHAQPINAAGAPTGDHWPMVEQYCVSCHNTTDWAGQLALDAVDHSHSAIPGDAETWEKVIKRLRGRLMPPPGEKRPSNEQLDSFVHWLEGTIDASAAKHTEPGYVPLHRLNRREYTNAIRDLLDLDFDPSSLLPQDDLSDGFDNVAKVLQVSPTFLDQYLAAARTVAVQAVGNPGIAARGHALHQSLRRSAAPACGRPAVRHARWLRGGSHFPGRRRVRAEHQQHGARAVGRRHGVREPARGAGRRREGV
ncbi:MAG: DUF1587 domain-containing protein [Proteobacteria bacterium]|nr:DUF1587 domain-containing protein [Pseudomonadota bacterium]